MRIRDTCAQVMSQAEHITLDNGSVEKLALKLSTGPPPTPWGDYECHYAEDVSSCGPLTAQFVAVVDAINFCFWEEPDFEYDTLCDGVKQALLDNPDCIWGDSLSTITAEELSSWFPPSCPLPLAETRASMLR